MKNYLLSKISLIRHNLPIIYFGLNFVILATALIMEYFFGLKPCKLCLYQRLPYYLTLFGGLAYFTLNQTILRQIILLICSIAFLAGAVLAFYHAGIEYGIFTNIFDCEASRNDFNDLADLKNHILANQAVPCDKPVFKFIFTLSGWNFFISTALGIFGINYILEARKKTQI